LPWRNFFGVKMGGRASKTVVDLLFARRTRVLDRRIAGGVQQIIVTSADFHHHGGLSACDVSEIG
jgi:hypothetical protein